MKVLFASHTGQVGGGERTLLDLLAGLPPSVVPVVACPTGPLATRVRAQGIEVATLPEIEASFRLHPWHTPRTLVPFLRASLRLRSVARRAGSDLIHANSTRAGLVAALASRLGAPPVVVTVRDCLPASLSGSGVRTVIRRQAAVVIANSRYTAANFAGARPRFDVVTIHNPVDLDRFDPQRVDRPHARARLGLDESPPVLGVVAQLAPWKAQDDAIRAVALLRSAWPALRLLLVGEAIFTSRATRYDNRSYAAFLRRLGNDLGLNGAVWFLGEREDVPQILRALDILLVPSWEEPFGRSVIEAMAMETPVVATATGGPSEIIRDGIDGILLPPRDPERWAVVLHQLLLDVKRRQSLGREARRRVVGDFGLAGHVTRVLDAYQKALAGRLN